MRYIILFLIMVSCQDGKKPRSVDFKFKEGDIVYIKVDNNRAVIGSRTIVGDTIPAYYVHYKDEDGDYSEDFIRETDLSKTKL